jgi:hypothetical protein
VAWVEFWNLDAHRGGPPREVTNDRPKNALELISAITAGREAIATCPAPVAETISGLVPHLVALPLRDATPAVSALVWRTPVENPLTDAFVATARELALSAAAGSSRTA